MNKQNFYDLNFYQLKDFFEDKCLTEEVKINQQNISDTLDNLIKVTKMDSPPQHRKSNHPNKSQKCTFQEHCYFFTIIT